MVGALSALSDTVGYNPADVDIVVGTSAGSVLAAMLGCGLTVADIIERLDVDAQSHSTNDGAADASDVHAALRSIPKTLPIPGNLRLAAKTVAHPRRHTVMTLASGLAPRGRGTLAPLAGMIANIQGGAGWPTAPTTWIVAMDYVNGQRVVFGKSGAPTAALPDAVVASSSAPGSFPPALVDGQLYLDGGAVSMTNADVLAAEHLDEILILAPKTTFAPSRQRPPTTRTDRRLRDMHTRHLVCEQRRLEAAGAAVHVLAPTLPDLHSMGANMMDPTRRREVLHTALWATRKQILAETAAMLTPRPHIREA